MMLPEWNQYFVVRREVSRTPKAVKLVVESPAGVKEVWFPRRVISLQRYEDPDGSWSWQVGVPNWLAAKTGLLGEAIY